MICIFSIGYIQLNTANILTPKKTTTISVHINNGENIHELQLILFKDEYAGALSVSKEAFDRYVSKSDSNYFVFNLDMEGCKYFQLNLNVKDINNDIVMKRNLMEAGDLTHIEISDNTTSFEGRGAIKMDFMQSSEKELEKLKDSVMQTIFPSYFSSKNIEFLDRDFKKWEIVKRIMKDKIMCKKNQFSNNVQRYLSAEIIGKIDYSLYYGANGTLTSSKFTDLQKDTIRELLKLNSLIDDGYVNNEEYLMSQSRIEADFQYYRFHYRLDKSNFASSSQMMIDYLNLINPKTVSWEKMMTTHIISTYHQIENLDWQVNSVLKTIKTPWYATQLEELIHSLNDQKEFELFNMKGDTVRLSSFDGKPIFIDFWFVGCLACTQYFSKSVSKAEAEFGEDVVFISICIEKEKDRWLKAIEGGKYTSSEVINLYTGKSYWKHPVISEFAVSSAPRPFLLDKDRKIISLNPNELGRGNYEILRKKLAEVLNK
ncbi:SCO family protein [Sphingobacterium faecium]|uniref:TlpA family protein disulfide reductase n=1 Tax=Sphingobacterium faecium TaxID=34087 RepID=UPI003209618D